MIMVDVEETGLDVLGVSFGERNLSTDRASAALGKNTILVLLFRKPPPFENGPTLACGLVAKMACPPDGVVDSPCHLITRGAAQTLVPATTNPLPIFVGAVHVRMLSHFQTVTHWPENGLKVFCPGCTGGCGADGSLLPG